MKSLPIVKDSVFEAIVDKNCSQSNPVTFTISALEELEETGNRQMAGTLISLCDMFFGEEDANTKVKTVTVVALVLRAINAAIESKELEELFE
jgi:hypothetical protein